MSILIRPKAIKYFLLFLISISSLMPAEGGSLLRADDPTLDAQGDTTPCHRAQYDAEHGIIRTASMIMDMYESNEAAAEYVDCYFECTGIFIPIEKQKGGGTIVCIFVAVILSMVLLVAVDNAFSGSSSFGDGSNFHF